MHPQCKWVVEDFRKAGIRREDYSVKVGTTRKRDSQGHSYVEYGHAQITLYGPAEKFLPYVIGLSHKYNIRMLYGNQGALVTILVMVPGREYWKKQDIWLEYKAGIDHLFYGTADRTPSFDPALRAAIEALKAKQSGLSAKEALEALPGIGIELTPLHQVQFYTEWERDGE